MKSTFNQQFIFYFFKVQTPFTITMIMMTENYDRYGTFFGGIVAL